MEKSHFRWTTFRGAGHLSAVKTCLALVISKIVDRNSLLSTWQSTGEKIGHTFGRQALPMFWDYVESNPFSGATGSVANALDSITDVLNLAIPHGNKSQASVASSSATHSPLADDMASALFTDPPY